MRGTNAPKFAFPPILNRIGMTCSFMALSLVLPSLARGDDPIELRPNEIQKEIKEDVQNLHQEVSKTLKGLDRKNLDSATDLMGVDQALRDQTLNYSLDGSLALDQAQAELSQSSQLLAQTMALTELQIEETFGESPLYWDLEQNSELPAFDVSSFLSSKTAFAPKDFETLFRMLPTEKKRIDAYFYVRGILKRMEATGLANEVRLKNLQLVKRMLLHTVLSYLQNHENGLVLEEAEFVQLQIKDLQKMTRDLGRLNGLVPAIRKEDLTVAKGWNLNSNTTEQQPMMAGRQGVKRAPSVAEPQRGHLTSQPRESHSKGAR